MKWKDLEGMDQVEALVGESFVKPQAIFKHSTRCYISKSVKSNFEADWNGREEATFYYLDLLNHRSISEAIAERFGIRHESPQLIVVKNGAVVYSESHDAIDAEAVLRSL